MKYRTIKTIIKNHSYLIAIVLFSFLIRFAGIKWGFPGTLHNDESVVIRSAMGMRFGDLNPKHFDWPSLYFYINYFIFLTFIKLRVVFQVLFGVETMRNLLPFWWGHELPFYYLGRLLTMLFSISNIILTYFISMKIFGNNIKQTPYTSFQASKNIALIATLFMGIGYWLVYMSYYALSDTALISLMLISFYFSLEITKSSQVKNYILAAVFAGLATSIKYHGVLICLVIPIAHLLREKNIKSLMDTKLILSAFISVTTFFIGSPYALLDWDTFIITGNSQGALWQISHMGFGKNWGYHLLKVIPENYGIPFVLLSYLGIADLLRHKEKNKKLIAYTFLVFLFYIGTWGIRRAHYALLMFPFLAVSGAYIFHKLTNKLYNKYIYYVVLFILLALPLYKSGYEAYIRYKEDTRAIAGRWIENNISKDTLVFVDRYLTGIYGGELPIFDAGNYKVIITPDIDKYKGSKYAISIQIIDRKNSTNPKHWYLQNTKEIFYVDNYLRTGPKIRILEYAKK